MLLAFWVRQPWKHCRRKNWSIDLPLFADGIQYRVGLDECNGGLEWWGWVECAVQIVGVHSRRSDDGHSWVDNVGLGMGGS